MNDKDVSIKYGQEATVMETLTIVFVVLKLCHVITWSWWLVLMPIWIELFVIISTLGFIIITNMRGRGGNNEKIK